MRKRTGLEDRLAYEIKWSRAVKNDLSRSIKYVFNEDRIRTSLYRPFVKQCLYYSKQLNEMTYQLDTLFPGKLDKNKFISIVSGNRLNFAALAGDALPNYAIYSLDPAQCLPLYRYELGQKIDNITDWALEQFTQHYHGNGNSPTTTPAQPRRPSRSKKANAATPTDAHSPTTASAPDAVAQSITKEAIFHYCYAVLHDPVYRQKYAQNLKREFPRIPLYPDFWRWAHWGAQLMALHIGFETVAPHALTRTDVPDTKARAANQAPKALLKSDPTAGTITLDTETTLRGIPPSAWAYQLGNRCAIDWVLDQYKEKKPKDPTIRERFNTYRFADHKEKVIDLLARVTTVSVQTVAITQAMQALERG